MLSDIVQKAAIGHQLCDELDGGGQADAQEAAHMRVVHTGHHIGFLQGKANRCVTIGSLAVAGGRGTWLSFRVKWDDFVLSFKA